jgi:hypothetical protein
LWLEDAGGSFKIVIFIYASLTLNFFPFLSVFTGRLAFNEQGIFRHYPELEEDRRKYPRPPFTLVENTDSGQTL